MRRFALLAALGCLVLASTAAGASADRFEGYVGGAVTGKGRAFVVGDGLNLIFIDRAQSGTPYRVCWHRLRGSSSRCWDGKTGAAGTKDRIFTAAPSAVGSFVVEWTVHGSRKAAWRFSSGVGD